MGWVKNVIEKFTRSENFDLSGRVYYGGGANFVEGRESQEIWRNEKLHSPFRGFNIYRVSLGALE